MPRSAGGGSGNIRVPEAVSVCYQRQERPSRSRQASPDICLHANRRTRISRPNVSGLCPRTRTTSPMTTSGDPFYGGIPVFRGFGRLMDPKLYSPLPDDWSIGVADIVESTKAIAEARYKAVNMAGASVIAAVANALQGREFPFVFGGDGASFAVSPDDLDRTREALAASAIWVEESLNLVMRVALVPVAAVRAQGLDVRVARFGPSPNLSYAMFSGGGLGWAEAAMKRGEFAVGGGTVRH